MHQPKRIIIRAPNWLGDHVMALQSYQAIRSIFSRTHITLLLPEGLKGLFSEKMFDEEWGFRGPDFKNKAKKTEWIRRIKEKKFDMSISFTASWSSALIFLQCRVPYRVGFSESGSGFLLNEGSKWQGVKSGKHKSEIYLDLVRNLGEVSKTFSTVTAIEKGELNKGECPFLILAPGASIPLREWPFFPELVFEIRKKYPDLILKIVGTESESVWKYRLNRWKLTRVEDWVGKTSILELRQLCSQAQLVIANDSGVAHVAATLAKTPTIVIFGPGNPKYIAPQGPKVFGLVPPKVACSPCEKPYCRGPFGYQKCLKEISVDAVLKQVSSVLSL